MQQDLCWNFYYENGSFQYTFIIIVYFKDYNGIFFLNWKNIGFRSDLFKAISFSNCNYIGKTGKKYFTIRVPFPFPWLRERLEGPNLRSRLRFITSLATARHHLLWYIFAMLSHSKNSLVFFFVLSGLLGNFEVAWLKQNYLFFLTSKLTPNLGFLITSRILLKLLKTLVMM